MPPPADELRRLFVDQRWSPARIGAHYGRSRQTVWRWLKQLDIQRPDDRPSPASQGLDQMPPPAEELRRLYVAERWDPERIGDHYGRSPSTVGRWLKKFDIRRPRLSWALTISAERLRELYDTPLTMDEIAEHEGVTRGQVERAMHRHNIQARDPSSWSPPARERPPAAELRRVYNEKESVRGVAGHYDVGVRTAHEWLSDPEVGIQLQPPGRPRMPTPSASSSWNRM